jgi:hypothetical protein
MRSIVVFPLFGLLAACGGDDGGGGGGVDAPSVNVPAMITITGTASKRDASGSVPQAGVTVAAFRNSDPNTPVVMTTTDASGNYTLTAPTDGKPIDGYVKGTYTDLLDTYLYPPEPLVADYAGASINMISADTLNLLSNLLCRNEQDLSKGVIAAIVEDAAGNPVTGAKVTSSPAAADYCYNMGGLPNNDAAATDTDGTAYMLNLTAGEATVNAMKTGNSFKSHKVNARAGALTTTLIVE